MPLFNGISSLVIEQLSSLMIHIYQPSARKGYDTRSLFKRSLTGLNSEFSFSLTNHTYLMNMYKEDSALNNQQWLIYIYIIYPQKHIPADTHTHIHTHIYIYIYTQRHPIIHIHIYIYINACMHLYIYVYIYKCIHLHLSLNIWLYMRRFITGPLA